MNAPADAAFEKAFATVQTLVDNFQANEKFYLSAQFSEADARLSFIDKFWTALGWDVNHETQNNPYQQEVKVEEPGKGAAAGKRADYAFSLAPDFHVVRFYVEAKKPSRHLKNADDYFQTMRYGWSSGPLSVLTDFEEFHILDCRFKPDIATALQTWNKVYRYREYSQREKFAEIYYLFGRDAVASGSLEKFAADFLPKSGAGIKRQRGSVQGGTQNLDEAFLAQLDEYRAQLSKAFKADNPELDALQLTEATQRVLDRLVFMRFLEDKLIEPEKMLAEIGAKNEAWRDFKKQTVRLDGIYNGVVFKKHFIDEAGFNTHSSSAVFGDICDELASNYSPYNFNAIPIHILGSIYERFLGKVIVADESGVRVDEKPEVRKAGGVYYTPEYIVRYIVEQTVGQLVEGKTPDEIKELRVADIACGSGSFLLGVYDRLLNFYTAFYNRKKNAAAARRAGCIERDGAWYLSLWQRREILLRHVFGVDIDAQAVEVAQISLYLKLLEDETTASARAANTLHGAILPSLTNNIVRGNSLIGTDILLSGLFVQQDEDARAEELKLCPMDFEDAFPKIMKSGGFDAIVGNPPYVRPHNIDPLVKNYFWEHYNSFTHKSDIYCCFMEQATSLLKPDGMFSYIVSESWLRLNSFQNVRKLVLENYKVLQLVDLPYKVFVNAQVNTGIFVLQKKENESERFNAKLSLVVGEGAQKNYDFTQVKTIPQKAFLTTFENVFDLSIAPETESIKDKMRKGQKIVDCFEIRFGLKTGDDSKFLHSIADSHSEDKPLLRGDDIKRYSNNYKGEFVWYVPSKMRLHRKTARPGEAERFEQPKCLVKDTTTDFAASYDDQNFYVKDVLIVTPRQDLKGGFDLKFLTGLINSRALRFYYRTTFDTLHVQSGELGSLPLPVLEIGKNKKDKARHDKLVQFVEQMLASKRDEAAAATESDKTYFANKCRSLDRRIDALVYELYGLTDEEIALVESA